MALLTTYIWEGAYVLSKLIEAGVPCTDLLLQKTWWRDEDGHGYSKQYLELLRSERNSGERTYFDAADLARGYGMSVHRVTGINRRETEQLLTTLDPTLVVVVGCPIIQRSVLGRIPGCLVNYHTGLLPEYRGPYSEFWAIFRDEPHMIGTTVHLIDGGVDTGAILARAPTDVGGERNPQSVHRINGRVGAGLMAKTIVAYLQGEVRAIPQDPDAAQYYTYPTETEILALSQRLGIDIALRFAD